MSKPKPKRSRLRAARPAVDPARRGAERDLRARVRLEERIAQLSKQLRRATVRADAEILSLIHGFARQHDKAIVERGTLMEATTRIADLEQRCEDLRRQVDRAAELRAEEQRV